LIRRDITVEDWSDSLTDQYGVEATTRYVLGILRANAIAKMINIKTTSNHKGKTMAKVFKGVRFEPDLYNKYAHLTYNSGLTVTGSFDRFFSV
jgi:hypothetical protein